MDVLRQACMKPRPRHVSESEPASPATPVDLPQRLACNSLILVGTLPIDVRHGPGARGAHVPAGRQDEGRLTGTSIASKVTGRTGPRARAHRAMRSIPAWSGIGSGGAKTRRAFSWDANACTTSRRAGRWSIAGLTPKARATACARAFTVYGLSAPTLNT